MAFAYNFVQTDAELSYSAEGGLTGIDDLVANRIPFAAVDMDVPADYYTQATGTFIGTTVPNQPLFTHPLRAPLPHTLILPILWSLWCEVVSPVAYAFFTE